MVQALSPPMSGAYEYRHDAIQVSSEGASLDELADSWLI